MRTTTLVRSPWSLVKGTKTSVRVRTNPSTCNLKERDLHAQNGSPHIMYVSAYILAHIQNTRGYRVPLLSRMKAAFWNSTDTSCSASVCL